MKTEASQCTQIYETLWNVYIYNTGHYEYFTMRSINQPANGLAWIEISLIRTSSRGRKVFSFTGSFSSSSRVSSPSIILLQRMSVSYNSLPSTIIT